VTATWGNGHHTTLWLEGEVERDQCPVVVRGIRQALTDGLGEVWVDLGSARHLHFEVAQALVQAVHDDRRLRLVGATPYVAQILCLAGGIDGEVRDGPGAEGRLGDAVA
jgi:hypothetical protein